MTLLFYKNVLILVLNKINMESLQNVLNGFPGKKILVVGDVMLDKYTLGSVERVNPEAPVMVLNVKEEFYKPGGAGNVAINVANLSPGGNVYLFGFVGEDPESEILKKILANEGVTPYFESCSKTAVKERFLGTSSGQEQQMLRVDKEETSPKTFQDRNSLLRLAGEVDFIIVSDYAKGTITTDLMSLLQSFKEKIIIDPKPENKNFKTLYQGVSLMTPNEKEAVKISGCSDVYEAGERLKEEFNANILITRGPRGMVLFTSGRRVEIPTYAREVYDVQGAGDTVIAAISLALSAGSSLEEAAIIGNHTAGIAIERKGTYSVKLNELKKRVLIGERKIVSFEELKKIVETCRQEGKKIIWTNGCFDVLHRGHLYSFEKAKEKGDILIVGLDSDISVRQLKGPDRPVIQEKDRAELLSAIESIDYITTSSPGGVANYLENLKPDVYVKSGDYTLDTINQEERRIVEGYGGQIYLPKGLTGLSTTSILRRIRNGR
jgi:D-beta-D-heptose 7-phosphate kinase/D-beta-D-heptose 1-phosphate adenosyltransferase